MSQTKEITRARETAEKWLELGSEFENPPKVTLELASQSLHAGRTVSLTDIASSTAIQCYSPGKAYIKERDDSKARAIADSTLESGHLTTRQHAHFTWHLDGVSRSLVHDVLHAHSFYNSEQQSQRYVEAKPGSHLVPANLTEEQRAIYQRSADFAFASYQELLFMLEPYLRARILDSVPRSWQRDEKRIADKVSKLSQEVARYVLPIGQQTVMHHTLSELSLLRLFQSGNSPHFTNEGRFLVASMIDRVGQFDPSIYEELRPPALGQPALIFNPELQRRQNIDFDNRMGSNRSVLISNRQTIRDNLVLGVRQLAGYFSDAISDSEIISRVLDPSGNPFLSNIYETGIHDPLTGVMSTVNVEFATRLSHTADSQRQRHRTTPGTTPSIASIFVNIPDFVRPMVIAQEPNLALQFDDVMSQMYGNVNDLLSAGVKSDYALLMLPNAHAIRLNEGGDLLGWKHRITQRLCHLAQEEISAITYDQALALQEIFPEAKNLFHVPCALRMAAGISPRCPEGGRFCGISVWNQKIDEYWDNRKY